jgi:hypothetical protein
VWIGLNAEGMVEVVDVVGYKSVAKLKYRRPPLSRKVHAGRQVCRLHDDRDERTFDLSTPRTRKETKRIKLESVPLGIVFSADGKTAFVTAGIRHCAESKYGVRSGYGTR